MGTIQRQNGTNGAENHGLYRLRSKNFSLAGHEHHTIKDRSEVAGGP